jgi:hypothetical protein
MMQINFHNYSLSPSKPREFTAAAQPQNNPVLNQQLGDTFYKTPQPEPKFSGWAKVLIGSLPFIQAGLSHQKNQINRSMQRDEERAERKRYEKRKHERYEKLGRPYREYDRRRRYYRTVTPITIKDGNGTTLGHKERVSGWHKCHS